MPVVLRQMGKAGKAKRAAAPKLEASVEGLSLPVSKSVIVPDFAGYIWLLYGKPKIGKTSMVAELDSTFFMMGEPGGKALSLYQRPVRKWAEALGYLKLLQGKDGKRFKAVALDGLEFFYDMCFEHVCERMAVSHPNDADDHGKTWREIAKEFKSFLNALGLLDKGLWLITHEKLSQVKRRDGTEFTQLGPSLPGQAWSVVEALVDIIAYYGVEEGQRAMTIRGDDFVCAGCRCSTNFLTKKGDPIYSFTTGNSAKASAAQVRSAFSNLLVSQGSVPSVAQKKVKAKYN